MERARTGGERRLRANLSAGTQVAEKTGTGDNTTNDVGLITLPEGKGHLAMAVLITDAKESTEEQEKLIAELEKEHADLQDKITERAAKYGLRLQDMENFAFSIMTVNDGWLSLQQTKDQIERTLTDLIIDAQPRPHP